MGMGWDRRSRCVVVTGLVTAGEGGEVLWETDC